MNTNGKKVVREFTGVEFLQQVKENEHVRIRIFADETIQVLGISKNLEVIPNTVIDASAKQQVDMKVEVTNLLRELGIPAHLKGYYYLRSAILLGMQDADVLGSMTKVLYPTLAKQYDSTPTKVERAIRNAIEVTWDRGNLEVIQQIFRYTVDSCKGRPSNSEFIALIVDSLKIQLKF